MKNLLNSIFTVLFMLILTSGDTSAQEHRYENILNTPYVFKMNNGAFFDCSNKAVLPIDLPTDAIGFFYEFTVLSMKDELDGSEQLLEKINNGMGGDLSEKKQPAVDCNTSDKYINTYFIAGFENMDKFQICEYKQYPLGGATHWRTGIGYFKNPNVDELFIGFENPYGRFAKVKVKVELVAVFSAEPN